jgi:hypothetical protein
LLLNICEEEDVSDQKGLRHDAQSVSVHSALPDHRALVRRWFDGPASTSGMVSMSALARTAALAADNTEMEKDNG